MTTAATRSLVIEKELPHPPEKIWRALTQGPLHRPARAPCPPGYGRHWAGWVSLAAVGVDRIRYARSSPLSAKRRIGENMTPTGRPNGEAASANITERIQELGDWRGETLAQVRQLIHDADPDIQEEWKWEK